MRAQSVLFSSYHFYVHTHHFSLQYISENKITNVYCYKGMVYLKTNGKQFILYESKTEFLTYIYTFVFLKVHRTFEIIETIKNTTIFHVPNLKIKCN